MHLDSASVRHAVQVILLAAAVLSGCGDGADDEDTRVRGDTLTVYMSVPAHGASAAGGEAAIAGAELALEEAGGSALGRRVNYQTLRAQYQTIQRMSQGLGGMEGYRMPALAISRHDPGRWTSAAGWLQGLNSGDPAGSAYWATAACRCYRPNRAAAAAVAGRRAACSSGSTRPSRSPTPSPTMGGHQVGAHARLPRAAAAGRAGLEGDVLNGLLRYHEMTAILDKVAAGELLGRRQDMAANQLLSHALEQLLARGKRLRDTEATTMNMQLVTWRDGARRERGDGRRDRRRPAHVAPAVDEEVRMRRLS